jgi:2-polyprenyl-3-methyl-5-hydroxy-6-metoxy-1,4-benzoquinol methylase
MAAVEARVPRHGAILEVGCGHGLFTHYLADTAPQRHVVGVDIDARKIELARSTIGAADRVRFDTIADGELPGGPFDAVVIVDVLYLFTPAQRDAMLAAAANRLAPGGVLVVKEVGTEPRWKATIAAVQERLATGVMGITEGEHRGFESAEVLAARVQATGLSVSTWPVDAGRLHPHVLVIGRRDT